MLDTSILVEKCQLKDDVDNWPVAQLVRAHP
jgi:hypothetical protein